MTTTHRSTVAVDTYTDAYGTENSASYRFRHVMARFRHGIDCLVFVGPNTT